MSSILFFLLSASLTWAVGSGSQLEKTVGDFDFKAGSNLQRIRGLNKSNCKKSVDFDVVKVQFDDGVKLSVIPLQLQPPLKAGLKSETAETNFTYMSRDDQGNYVVEERLLQIFTSNDGAKHIVWNKLGSINKQGSASNIEALSFEKSPALPGCDLNELKTENGDLKYLLNPAKRPGAPSGTRN